VSGVKRWRHKELPFEPKGRCPQCYQPQTDDTLCKGCAVFQANHRRALERGDENAVKLQRMRERGEGLF
jgi:hypothetical protein